MLHDMEMSSTHLNTFDVEQKLDQRNSTHKHIHPLVGVQFAVLVDLTFLTIEPADHEDNRLRIFLFLLKSDHVSKTFLVSDTFSSDT
jgi:hypothetical protein